MIFTFGFFTASQSLLRYMPSKGIALRLLPYNYNSIRNKTCIIITRLTA